jgi:hypothetical protein
MIVRVGLPEWNGQLVRVVAESGAPALVSAGRLWQRGRIRHPRAVVEGVADVALDSAGFVAMVKHGGYPWSAQEYVRMSMLRQWAWWSQMDYCCEPQIAKDQGEVTSRVARTGAALVECRAIAADLGAAPPMPVLQGWRPDDYLRSMDLLDSAGSWPALVGVGSVCRRHLGGPDGLFSVVERIGARLPKGTKLHLFGVKGAALPELERLGLVHSTDSCAWDYAGRMKVTREERRKYRMPDRVRSLVSFIGASQRPGPAARPTKQLTLW